MAAGVPAAGPGPAELLEQELGVLVRRSRMLTSTFAAAVHPDLRAGGYSVLLVIQESPDLRSSDIAERLGLDRSTISRVIAQLGALGLVVLEPDRRDGRARFVRLSPNGIERLAAVGAHRRSQLHEYLSTWQPDELVAFGAMVRRLNTDLVGGTGPFLALPEPRGSDG